jgi:hypothetical protein
MQMQEAPVVLMGEVFAVRATRPDDQGQATGAKIAVLALDGATEVKLNPDQLRKVAPVKGDRIVWFVRPRAWAMEGSSGVSFGYVAAVDFGDLDLLQSMLHDSGKTPAATK